MSSVHVTLNPHPFTGNVFCALTNECVHLHLSPLCFIIFRRNKISSIRGTAQRESGFCCGTPSLLLGGEIILTALWHLRFFERSQALGRQKQLFPAASPPAVISQITIRKKLLFSSPSVKLAGSRNLCSSLFWSSIVNSPLPCK